ncbi:hypothetical protein GGI26_001833 [Coemansia sp. RSA 1358]|nr:hypothetical protein GGI26_001833 [Coemansia sp. RSA 1358]
MLKFMSLTGSIAACTATVSTGIAQLQDALGENDLGVHSLALASFVSIMSTVVITKMFSPFVTKVIMLPTASTKSIKIDKHGLPTFESILSASRTKDAAGPKLNRHFSLSGSATKDTVLVLETPGLFGFNSRHTKVGINDLAPSPKRMRTWDMTATKIRLLREKGIKPPVTTFTIMWRSLKDSPNRRLLEEINSLVGSD